jgi:hypothetical protein
MQFIISQSPQDAVPALVHLTDELLRATRAFCRAEISRQGPFKCSEVESFVLIKSCNDRIGVSSVCAAEESRWSLFGGNSATLPRPFLEVLK